MPSGKAGGHKRAHGEQANESALSEANPILIEVTRGRLVESRHRGAAVVVDAHGRIVARWGDVDTPVYPRSALKPLQALSWVETGVAERFSVSSQELAIACGSHSAETSHVACVTGWLARLGLEPRCLICGPHAPYSEAASAELIRAGDAPSALHNNCSGKHAGFLTACLDRGEPVAGYANPSHAVQVKVREVVEQMAGVPLALADIAQDGCGAPIYAMPLTALALGFARLAAPASLPSVRAAAVRRICEAIAEAPHFVAGSGCFDTRVIALSGGAVIVKGGAEGVHAAALPASGFGIALKIDDGGKRAREAAIAALLRRYAGGADTALDGMLAESAAEPVLNTLGEEVGRIRVASRWLE